MKNKQWVNYILSIQIYKSIRIIKQAGIWPSLIRLLEFFYAQFQINY